MENPALPALRPLRLGELLDQAIRLYRRNFITFVGIVAMVYVPLMILQIASTTLMTSSMVGLNSSNPEEIFTNYAYWGGILSSLVVAFLQFIFVQGIATGALTRAVADNYLGKTTSILGAYRGIGKSWLPLLGALLFIGLLAIAILFWWLVPCVGWITGLGMFVILLTAVSPLVAPVVVVEGQGVLGSVRRAWSLVRRRFWPVLGYVFVLYLFSLLIVTGPSLIINAVLLGAFQTFDDPTSGLVIRTIVQSLVQLVSILIYYPLQMAAFTLIYFDLRVRTEGFDLALLTADASDQVSVDQAMAAPVAVSGERLITGTDLGNFAIMTLAAVGIYIFIFSFIMGSVMLLPALFR